jgi:stage II sporulation protein D
MAGAPMSARMSARRGGVALAAFLLGVSGAAGVNPAAFAGARPLLGRAATAAGRAPEQSSPAAGLSPITFVPASPGASETVRELFPQVPGVCPPNQPQPVTAAYPGSLEVGLEANGSLYLISQMTFTQYLDGIAEVPPSWPMAALKAQVVAARTYALAHMNGPTVDGLHYDLCATDACQVYTGTQVQNGAWGDNWEQAVNSTAGQILEYQGKPIDAFYFSTSNGHTYSNAQVFGGTPLPYLQPVVENDDTASPTSTWSVPMPLSDLAQILSLAGAWGGGTITSVTQQGSSVAISGPGQSVTLSLSRFRNDLNAESTCLTPRRYPTAATSGGHLPQTVPSIWMTLTQQGDEIVMNGRGWGHGVGMVQWGAHGRAELGESYTQILAYYYGGLKPVTVTEPGSIRVLLATGVQQVTVAPTGLVGEQGGPSPTLTGPVTITGGASMTIAPAGAGAIPATVSVTGVTVTATASAGHPAGIGFTLNHSANVGLAYAGASVSGTVAPAPFTGGTQYLPWDPIAAGLAPGTYQVALIADDGVSQVQTAPVSLTVAGTPAASSPSPAAAPRRHPASSRGPAPALVAAIVAGALLLAAGTALLLLRRKPS